MNLRELVSDARVNRGLWWQQAWSLVAGCTPVSEACQNCWAATMAHRQGMRQKLSDAQWKLWEGLTTDQGKWNGQIRCLEHNLELPLKIKKPTLFSIWNDLFHPDVSDRFIFKALSIMTLSRHFYLLLTKRIDRALTFFQKPEIIEAWYGEKRDLPIMSPPSNLGLGVTVELPKYLHRIETLLYIPAALHFVSLEPLLGELSIAPFLSGWSGKNSGLPHRLSKELEALPDIDKLDWVIVGCESGSKRRPMKDKWASDIIKECVSADVPIFLKQKEVNGRMAHAPTIFNGNTILQFPEVERMP